MNEKEDNFLEELDKQDRIEAKIEKLSKKLCKSMKKTDTNSCKIYLHHDTERKYEGIVDINVCKD